MKDTRPVNIDLTTIRFPLTAILSITHRITGVIIFIGVAILLYLLGLSLESEAGFAEAQQLLSSPLAKFVVWGIVSEITSYAMTNDAYQVVAPHPEGIQIERCMHQALKNKSPDLINAHATSTPMGDYIELDAIKRLGLHHSYITANKSQLGHMMGAAGSMETAMSVLSIRDNKITPSVNIDALADGYDWVNYTSTSIDKEVNSVLCNSFGFGGTNASIMIESV